MPDVLLTCLSKAAADAVIREWKRENTPGHMVRPAPRGTVAIKFSDPQFVMDVTIWATLHNCCTRRASDATIRAAARR